MNTQIFDTYNDFLNREDKGINGVSPHFAEHNKDFEKQNKTNKGCYDCSRCYDCSDCYRSISIGTDKQDGFSVPVIQNIHNTVINAASKDKALDMANWHTCDTTHCRAGWVVHLAGKEGYQLESKTSTLFAAMQIYKKSSNIKVSPTRFFEDNEQAMNDMERCAKLEKEQAA